MIMILLKIAGVCRFYETGFLPCFLNQKQPPEVFCKKGVFKNFLPQDCNFIKKEILAQVCFNKHREHLQLSFCSSNNIKSLNTNFTIALFYRDIAFIGALLIVHKSIHLIITETMELLPLHLLKFAKNYGTVRIRSQCQGSPELQKHNGVTTGKKLFVKRKYCKNSGEKIFLSRKQLIILNIISWSE